MATSLKELLAQAERGDEDVRQKVRNKHTDASRAAEEAFTARIERGDAPVFNWADPQENLDDILRLFGLTLAVQGKDFMRLEQRTGASFMAMALELESQTRRIEQLERRLAQHES